MKKNLILTFAILMFFGRLIASTSITSATVSGTWTAAGSPYLVFNNIKVDSGQTLVIQPGVEVIFQGAYGIDVSGILCAKGTSVKPILFHAQDTTGWSIDTTEAGGWRGIHYLGVSLPIDSSSFEYCTVTDLKSIYYGRTLAHFCSFRSIAIRHCNFYHNKSLGTGGVVMVTNDPPFYLGPIQTISCEISNCSFHDNIGNENGWDSTYTPRQQLPGSIVSLQGCSPAVVDSNNFSANVGDRVLYVLGDSAIVTNNTIGHNVQADMINTSFVDYYFSKGIFYRNIVHANTSHLDAMVASEYSSLDINANNICNNSCGYMWSGGFCPVADGGAAIRFFNETYSDSVVYHNFVRNNIIVNNNTGTYGSAVYDYGVSVKIVNNTIVNNYSGWGNTIYLDFLDGQSPKMIVKNNIVYGNSGNFHINNQAAIEISHNWFNTSLGGQLPYPWVYARLNADTLNVIGDTAGLVAPTLTDDYMEDALAASFYLTRLSSCIHAGDTTNAYPDSTDFSGKSRLTAGRIDIGAYQYHGGLTAGSVTVPNRVELFPNPASEFISVQTPDARGAIVVEDIAGRTICEKAVKENNTRISLPHLPAGLYFAVWNNGVSTSTQKFEVQ